MFLEPDGWTLTLTEQAEKAPFRGKAGLADITETTPARGAAVRMTWLSAIAQELAAESQLPGCHHYFLGNDRAKWRTDVPLYGAVRYRQMLPGTDVLVREQEGHFEYDLIRSRRRCSKLSRSPSRAPSVCTRCGRGLGWQASGLRARR